MDDIDQEEYKRLFESIKKGIGLPETNDPDNQNIEELKLIISDNVSQDCTI